MLAIEINGLYLDLSSGTGVDFEKTSTLFDNQAIRGSSSLAIDGPLTDHNRMVLGFPDALDNDRPFGRRYQCAVYYAGIRYTKGLFTIDSTDAQQFQGYVIFDNLDKKIKDRRLPDFDYGGEREIGTHYLFVLDHVKATALADPGEYDYVFAPLYNPDLYTDAARLADDPVEDFINRPYWDYKVVNPLFIWEESQIPQNAMAITPYPFLVSVLRYIFGELGYSIYGDFVIHTEIKQLCIYNNYILDRYVDGENQLQTTLHLKNHVPDITVKDFVDSIRNQFCLYLDVNSETRQINISFRKDAFTKSKVRDVTPYVTREFKKQQGAKGGMTFEQKADSGDALQKNLEPRVVVGDGEETVTIKCGFITDAELTLDNNTYLLPYAYQPGTSADPYYTEPDIQGDTLLGANPFAFRLFFFRGYQPCENDAFVYPHLTSGTKNVLGESVGVLSTNFFDTGGGYGTFWQEWIELMLYTEKVERKIIAPLTFIAGFTPYERIRAENSLYIPESLRFTLTDKRADLVEGSIIMYKLNNKPVRGDLGDGTNAVIILPPPTPPVPAPVTIYVRFHLYEWTIDEGWRFERYANIDLEFFSDPGGVVPYSVSNLPVLWHFKNEFKISGKVLSSTDEAQTRTIANGYSVRVFLNKRMYLRVQLVSPWERINTAIIDPTAGYEILPNIHEPR